MRGHRATATAALQSDGEEDRSDLRLSGGGASNALTKTIEAVRHGFRIGEHLPGGNPKHSEAERSHICVALSINLLALIVRGAVDFDGTLEDRPRYNNTLIFDPFPFPTPHPSSAPASRTSPKTRKAALAETDKPTMTVLYNLRGKLWLRPEYQEPRFGKGKGG